MICQRNNKLIVYKFKIQAVSPVRFGANNQKELVEDSQGRPILFGNSIGGALREYLKICKVPENTIYTYMGGNKNNEFVQSQLYISDGEITECEVCCKEGSAIDSAFGSAREHHKYELEYLSEGSVITFKIEYQPDSLFKETEFHKVVGTWEHGFRAGNIRLGGQQNNGWGKFKLKELKKKEFVFRTQADLEEYIFRPSAVPFTSVSQGELPCYEIAGNKQVTLTLKGEFPYGLYQAFTYEKNQQLSGLQRMGDSYYLPASSFKGIMRSEVKVLLGRFFDEEEVEKRLAEIFGDKDRKGKVIFFDVILENSLPVKVKRFDKDQNPLEGDPVYIKIDRFTGGAIEGALKRQREIYGNAVLQCRLTLEQEQDIGSLFPLIYVLRRIGSGLVPLGGRTAAGLGEFSGSQVRMTGAIEGAIPTDNNLSTRQINNLKGYYNSFLKGWCSKCNI